MNTLHKIVDRKTAVMLADSFRKNGQPIVFTNGCFDIIHPGHVSLLERAASRGVVFVGVNSDESVRALKGDGRPLNKEADRIRIVAAMGCVSVVFGFNETRVVESINAIQPDFWVKGGDYTFETLDKDELAAANNCGSEICLLASLDGYSTTSIIKKLGN